jgi:hypothetical protein
MFEPAIQLHIHSPGGRTYAKAVKEKEIKGMSFPRARSREELKRKGSNLREAQNLLDAEAARIIPRAPKSRKHLKDRSGSARPAEERFFERGHSVV